MAVGLASSIAASLLDALFNSVAYDGPTNIYAKFHVGDPGAAGTSNAAVETDRDEVTFGAASGGAIANDAEVQLVNVAGSEDYTHLSLWDNPTAGNFMASGTVTANPVTAGDTFTIAVGDFDVNLTNIAA